MAPASPTIAVFAEPGHKWLFVSALDWPGWARRGKTEELALATLESYLPRYAPIVARARLADLLETEWAAFDEVAGAAPERLRKGPRGGGRDTAQIVAHVRDAEAMYVRTMGLPRENPLWRATGGAQGPVHADLTAALRAWMTAALRDPASLVTPPKGWPPRYAARRIGWHVLDHLWEIEDKS